MKNYCHLTSQRDRGDFACCRKAGVTVGFDYALEKAVAGSLLREYILTNKIGRRWLH